MIHGLFLVNRSGNIRLSRFYFKHSKEWQDHQKNAIIEIVINEGSLGSNSDPTVHLKESGNINIIYRRYANVYAMLLVDKVSNIFGIISEKVMHLEGDGPLLVEFKP